MALARWRSSRVGARAPTRESPRRHDRRAAGRRSAHRRAGPENVLVRQHSPRLQALPQGCGFRHGSPRNAPSVLRDSDVLSRIRRRAVRQQHSPSMRPMSCTSRSGRAVHPEDPPRRAACRIVFHTHDELLTRLDKPTIEARLAGADAIVTWQRDYVTQQWQAHSLTPGAAHPHRRQRRRPPAISPRGRGPKAWPASRRCCTFRTCIAGEGVHILAQAFEADTGACCPARGSP